MNVRKMHLAFKLPNLGESRSRKSGKTSTRNNPHLPHINPRVRAYGKARLDITRRVQTQQDWDALWKPPTHPFPFTFSGSSSWKQCLEYQVDDFAAEIGFWIDILGLQVVAFGPDYVQFNSPGGEFTFAVSAAIENQASTPPGSFRIQFYIEDFQNTVQELQRRSIQIDQAPLPTESGTGLQIATFHTPHGIPIDLWGIGEPRLAPEIFDERPVPQQETPENTQESHDFPGSRVDGPRGSEIDPSSLELYTWDEEDDQASPPEFLPVPKEAAEPLPQSHNWPVSPNIAADLNLAKRSRQVSEESPPYALETSPGKAEADELQDDLEDWEDEPEASTPDSKEEYPETITYEPID